MKRSRQITEIPTEELLATGVWRWSPHDDDSGLVPAKRVPVSNSAGCLFATQVVLADSSRNVAIIGNLDATNVELNAHFLTISLLVPDGHWFHLARYHDLNADEHGPAALARALGHPVDQVFPIRYDVRRLMRGNDSCTQGSVTAEPSRRLSRAEIIALAVPAL